MNNQTLLNEQKNRGAYNKNALESAIRSIWQGFLDEDRTFYSVIENAISGGHDA